MYTDLFKPLLKEFGGQMESINNRQLQPAQRLLTSSQYILTVIDKLRILIKDQPFPSQAEEINFFKNIKPGIYAHKIFEEEYYKLKLNQPSGPPGMIKSYLADEIAHINRFFNLNSFHYQYYKMNAVELDPIYFVRGAHSSAIPIIDIPELNPDFSTGMDYVFSRFIAYERLINNMIRRLNDDDTTEKKEWIKRKLMKWTGNKVGVVELAYGLYYSGEINHGEVEVQDIVEVFEFVFDIVIGDGHRKFVDIRNRKNVSPTQLLDKMRTAILQRVEEDMVYRSNRGIRLRKPIK